MVELLNHTNPDQSSSWYRWLIMHKKWKGINFVTVTFVDLSLSFVVTIQYAPHRHRWKHTPQGPTASTFHSVINSVPDWHPVSFQVSEWLFNLFQKIFFQNPSDQLPDTVYDLLLLGLSEFEMRIEFQLLLSLSVKLTVVFLPHNLKT